MSLNSQLPKLTSPLCGGREGGEVAANGGRHWATPPPDSVPPHPCPPLRGGRGRFGRLRSRGFSLIELLVVLILIGIMAGVTGPAVGRFLDSLELKKQTEKVMAAIRYARLTAITKGKLLVLTVTEGEEGSSLSLSGAVEEVRSLGLAEEATLEVDPEELVFLPEGYATPGTLTVRSGARSETIVIDPLTALPMLEQEDE